MVCIYHKVNLQAPPPKKIQNYSWMDKEDEKHQKQLELQEFNINKLPSSNWICLTELYLDTMFLDLWLKPELTWIAYLAPDIGLCICLKNHKFKLHKSTFHLQNHKFKCDKFHKWISHVSIWDLFLGNNVLNFWIYTSISFIMHGICLCLSL